MTIEPLPSPRLNIFSPALPVFPIATLTGLLRDTYRALASQYQKEKEAVPGGRPKTQG
jgi:hypothetical protein